MTARTLTRRALLAAATTAGAAALPGTATARTLAGRGQPVTSAALPDGFAPEGIAIDRHGIAYFGSRVTGAVHRVDLATGAGSGLAAGPGTPCLGLKADRAGRLFAAGGTGGDARVLDTATGRTLAAYRLLTPPATGFVNDVVLTPDAAFLTDSHHPVLYVLPLGPRGALPAPRDIVAVPLTGFPQPAAGLGANGITTTPDGRALLVVHTSGGALYRVDPRTGAAAEVDLGGASLAHGDGLLRRGRTLYAVLNRVNRLAVITLDARGRTGAVTGTVTAPAFDVPTTVAAYRGRLYLPNARFTTPVAGSTAYHVVSVPLP
ncbi:hypothetical protein GCM10027168_31320 [Streptomyces capparidis]